jgi:murein DD-endopeptidase MepM/ murein hydrolase activator NlpD
MSFERAWRLPVLMVLLVALSAVLVAPASAGSSEEARLEATKARLATVSAELRSAKSQQSQDAAAFAKAERQLAVVMEALNSAEQAVARQQEAVDEAAAKLARLERAEAEQQAAMSDRAIEIYKQGTMMPLGTVLMSGSPQEAMRRTALVDAVNRADRASFEQITITQTAIAAQRKQLKVEQASLERVAEQQREIAAQAEELRNDKALQLAATSSKVRQLAAQENHLEAESRQIAALARRAERAAAASRSAAAPAASAPAATAVSGGSGWVWPASGPVTSEFGYRWGRQHAGIDIGAPTGAPIYAVTDGVVSYAGSMGGYGSMVMIDHGGGIVTAYAHQSAILVSVGTRVARGQQIGRVGSTGNSTGPHLHFEVRVGGQARNPRGYL